MITYRDLSGGSGVTAYETGTDYIMIVFATGQVYRYSHRRAGNSHVSNMKNLAAAGRGLNSYINKHVKFLYD